MASPQLENGYIRISSEFADILAKTDLSGSELRIILAVMRKTWGWHKKKDRISLSQLAKMTLLEPRQTRRVLAGLVQRGVIIRESDRDKNVPSNINILGINKDYETWKDRDKIVHGQKCAQKQGQKCPTQKIKKDNYCEEFEKFFTHWNSLSGLRKLQDKETTEKKDTRAELGRALKKFPLEEILGAVNNYSTVLSFPGEYFFSYKWPPSLFLKRGLKQFLSVNEPLDNFKIKKALGGKQHARPDPAQLARRELAQ